MAIETLFASETYQLLTFKGTPNARWLYSLPVGEQIQFGDQAYDYEEYATAEALNAEFVSRNLNTDQLDILVPEELEDGEPNPDYVALLAVEALKLEPADVEPPDPDPSLLEN